MRWLGIYRPDGTFIPPDDRKRERREKPRKVTK